MTAAIAAPISPEAKVESFYRWYLKNDTSAVVQLKRPAISNFVAARTLARLRDDLERGTLPGDNDYFLKSQDIGDDWIAHIHAQPACLLGDVAIVPVTIGTRDMKTQFVVFLHRERSEWRIIKVSSLDAYE